MKPNHKEIERQLSESRREFWAADATINNLEQKLADMEAQLANTEKRIAELESLTQLPHPAPVSVHDERAAFETFMEKRFGESVDRRRAKNGDREYMAWDMALGWIIWCHRAAMLQCPEPVTDNTNQQFESLSRDVK